MRNKLCRVCWNTNGWRRPAGVNSESGSDVATNGFGHEEWLFNYEWCIDGFRYGYLQPISRYRSTYERAKCSIALYTKKASFTLLVAIIKEVYVPDDSETAAAFNTMVSRGWTRQMRDDVVAVNGDTRELDELTPQLAINVRFRPSDVTILDPMPVFPPSHKCSVTSRYHPLNWDADDVLPTSGNAEAVKPDRRTLPYLRAAQDATVVDLAHTRMQTRLYESLCKDFGSHSVHFEDHFVDLKVSNESDVIFYEIKTCTSVKQCVRQAIGQLLEYAAYPDQRRASKWIVVGDAMATDDDKKYLAFMRSAYGLPVFYGQFDWANDRLTSVI